MNNNLVASVLAGILIIMLGVLFILLLIWLIMRVRLTKNGEEKSNDKSARKTKVQQNYNIQPIFDFMEFDKIDDNMIIQNNGKKFLMAIKCQGINYDLMSKVEKASVEQGFIQFLNTLRNPIQIYVQTRTVDLTGSINTYKNKIKELGNKFTQKEFEYNQKVRSEKYDQQTLNKEHFELVKARNLYEYGVDIVSNTERMSLNKNILSKQYFIIFSHIPEEAYEETYTKEEVKNIAFSELYTRAQSTISLLSVCGINSKILDSMELTDLLYTAYNRDEAEMYDLKKAINEGYDNLYTTAPDVLEKRMKELDKQIEMDAIEKANEAIYEVKQEQENKIKEKQEQEEYDEVVASMAKMILNKRKNNTVEKVRKVV